MISKRFARATRSLGMAAATVLAAMYACAAVLSAEQQTPEQQGVRITGTVVDAYPGVTPTPDRVSLVPDMTSSAPVGFGEPLRRVALGADRTFAFDNVPPGPYRLVTVNGSEVVVTVGSADVTGVELRHVGLAELYPSLRTDDGSELPSDVRFNLEISDGTVLAGAVHPDRVLNLPPGRRAFFVLPPEGWHVRSMTSAGVDLLRQPLDIDMRASERGIAIVLTRTADHAPALARVRGRVTGGAAPSRVQLTPTMPVQKRAGASASAEVAPDGTFDVELEPGIYDVHVPPARRVVRGLVVPLSGTTVDVKLPDGQLFAGGAVRVVDPAGRSIPYGFGTVVLVAQGPHGVARFPIETAGFWGTLLPGEYRLTVEDLPPGVGIAMLEADGRNLLEDPYVVMPDRTPPPVTLVLRYSGPQPDWVRQLP